MQKTVLNIAILILAAGVTHLSAQESGSASATMQVSVTVVEPSSIQASRGLQTRINGERISALAGDSRDIGKVLIPAPPDTEMSLSITGETRLIDGNGGTITFMPEAHIGRNVEQEKSVAVNGDNTMIRFTESDNGGYRGIAELTLFGTVDTGSHTGGSFSTVYTVTKEHF